MKTRLALLALLIAAVVGAIVVLQGGEDGTVVPPPPKNGDDTPVDVDPTARTAFVSATQCQDCHAEVYAEWEESYHAMAWTDPMVQALSDGFRKTECIDCHAPQPIHITGVAKRVAPRQHARREGVDCLSCHLLEDGVSVAASRDVDTSATPGACRPRHMPVMQENLACAGCHNQHETVDELEATGRDERCQTCHMPEVDRPHGDQLVKGRSHRFPGAHSLDMHRKATKFEVALENGVVVARTTNVGGAHHIPTDARHRSYNVWISMWDDRGNPQAVDVEIDEYRLYYRDDFKESTQLADGQTRTAEWPVPEGLRGRVEVRLTYALNPEELAAKRVMEVWKVEVEVR